MKKYLFTLLVFSIAISLHAQVHIRGKVVDAKTQERLAFCNILLKGKAHYGTISNEQGIFDILIPSNEKWPCTLTISLLGYETKEVSITQDTKQITIALSTSLAYINEVIIKEKENPNRAREILDSAFLRFNDNMAFKYKKIKNKVSFKQDDLSPLTFYGRTYVSFNKKYFFADEMVIDFSKRNALAYDTILAYKLHADKTFLNNNKDKDYYHLNIMLLRYNAALYNINKYRKYAFIDRVFEKDGHIIYVIVVSKKLNKESYRLLLDSIKIDPTWATQHEEAFEPIVRHKIKLYKYWIDKTDNYKFLKEEFLTGRLNSVFGLYMMTRLYKEYDGKMYPFHSQSFSFCSIEKDSRFSESILLHINDSISIYKPKDLGEKIYVNNLNVMFNNVKDTTWGSWKNYNTLTQDSLAREVMNDIIRPTFFDYKDYNND